MILDEREAFGKLLAKLCHVYDRPIDHTLADAYWQALSDVAFDAVLLAAARALRESRGFPTPATLRMFAGADVGAKLQELRDYMRRSPLGYPANLPADLKPVVRKLGGWARVGNMSADELTREFRANYQPDWPPEPSTEDRKIAASTRSLIADIGSKKP